MILGTIYILYRNNNSVDGAAYRKDIGRIFGTVYQITYQYPKDLKNEIEAELKRFDASLSPFNANSIISRVNRNEEVEVDTFFRNVFFRSKEISEQTDGAFDITIAPLINVWGFGFKKEKWPDSLTIDSLKQFTGYRMVELEEGRVVKKDPRVMISCSAIAKGYASDVVAGFLDRKGVKNYMVEIGGEVVVKGVNPRSEGWTVGISKPSDDQLVNQELELVFRITDAGVATSGNYRNFYYKDGKKYAHTIDPRTGHPVERSLLSATVIAEDCMTADALATAFMVMGLEKAKAFVSNRRDIDVCFIYEEEDGELNMFMTEDLKKFVISSPQP